MLIFVKLFVIVGARKPRPLTNAGWKPQTIQVELIVGRDSYLDTKTLIWKIDLQKLEIVPGLSVPRAGGTK